MAVLFLQTYQFTKFWQIPAILYELSKSVYALLFYFGNNYSQKKTTEGGFFKILIES